MKFWDASAIVPLLVGQPSTVQLKSLSGSDPKLLVWWASEVECTSALTRLEREKFLSGGSVRAADDRLHELSEGWDEVEPSESVRETAQRFLRVHSLRAADSLQRLLQGRTNVRRLWSSLRSTLALPTRRGRKVLCSPTFRRDKAQAFGI